MPRSHPRLSWGQNMILEEETYEKFGYYPSDWKSQSSKKILATCDSCGKIRETSKHGYRSLCVSCTQKIRKGAETANWQGGKIKRICLECEKVFHVYPSRIRRGGGKFCSPKCKYKSKEFKQKIREARTHQKFPTHHTKPELIFEQICERNNLPFKYTGDGSFWIGKNPAINPDFVECNGKKIVVEIFGYWHNPLKRHCKIRYSATFKGRKKILKKHKWTLIVFWQEDLEREDAEQFVLSELQKYNIL